MSTVTKPDDVVLHANFNSPPVHPSDFINAALLSQNPDAKVALTHDDIWCDLLRNNFPKLDYAELMNSARLYTSTIDEYGGVSLEKISDSSNVLDGDSGQFQGTEAPVIQTLPRELVEYILLLLDIDSMLTCTLVNKEFNEIIQSSTFFQDFLARQPYLEEFNRLRVVRVGFDHVERFCTSLSNLYKSVAAESIDRNRWKVTKISMFKSTLIAEHEFLVADVVCGQMIVYLRFEQKTHKSTAGPITTYFLSKTALDEITYSKVYTDVVHYEECLEVIRFPEGKGLSLPQIVVLACCVISFKPNYPSWFVHVMGEAAKLIETDFTSETMSKRKRSARKRTNEPTLDTIQQVKAKYDQRWTAFNQDIYDTILITFKLL